MATPVIMPRKGQSVESCIISEWIKKPGEKINEGENLLSYETDKATFDLPSPASGTILETFFQEGDEVPVLVNIAVIGKEGEDVEPFRPEKPAESKSMQEVQKGMGDEAIEPDTIITDEKPVSFNAQTGKVNISPRAKKLAEKLHIQYQSINGTGPGNRIIEKDIKEVYERFKVTPLASDKAQSEGKTIGKEATGAGGIFRSADMIEAEAEWTGDYTITKVTNIRRIIAEKMHSSLQNSAQLTHHTSADSRNILSFREQVKKDLDQGIGENITLNDMVCFATIQALKKMPGINSHFLGDRIQTFTKVHLGIAVDTDRGLMVPALRNADDLSLSQLSVQLRSLAEQCRKGSIDPGMLDSKAATFTVSNLGTYGVEMFTPVLNLPQAGILGVNTIIQRPADIGNGVVGFIPFIGLSLTYDHRVLDGAPASAFLKEVKEQVENFNTDVQ